jgi:hypothetical protein
VSTGNTAQGQINTRRGAFKYQCPIPVKKRNPLFSRVTAIEYSVNHSINPIAIPLLSGPTAVAITLSTPSTES